MVETLVAAGILLIGISAAAMLSLTMLGAEEGNTLILRALNQQEQAAKLYQLGLPTNTATGLLLSDRSVMALQFTSLGNNTTSNIVTERAELRLVYRGGGLSASSANPGGEARTNDVVLFRPTLR